jgi:hypothetical protein
MASEWVGMVQNHRARLLFIQRLLHLLQAGIRIHTSCGAFKVQEPEGALQEAVLHPGLEFADDPERRTRDIWTMLQKNVDEEGSNSPSFTRLRHNEVVGVQEHVAQGPVAVPVQERVRGDSIYRRSVEHKGARP